MSTEHIARNRRAKAVALATVLHDCTTITCHSDVYDLTPAAWELAAQAATARKLLGVGTNGKPNRVHVPHSIETVAAVERELRMLAVEARVEVEQPAPLKPGDRVHHTDGQAVWTLVRPSDDVSHVEGQWLVECQSPTSTTPVSTWIVPSDPQWVRVPPRRATDSQGYRDQMARIAPLPEDPFAAFARADQPHAIR